MTKQEAFKKRVRARMQATGERYSAARRVLLARTGGRHGRVWVAEPETADASVSAATGKSWDEWCDVIDAWPGRTEGHTATAAYLRETHDVDAWWAQTITIGYERITGLRLPYQRPDGTFTASKSMTISINTDELRSMLLADEHRVDLFPGLDTELRSKPTSKAIRLSVGPGVAIIDLEPKNNARTKVTVAHENLPAYDDVAEWKFYWSEWLEALDESQRR